MHKTIGGLNMVQGVQENIEVEVNRKIIYNHLLPW